MAIGWKHDELLRTKTHMFLCICSLKYPHIKSLSSSNLYAHYTHYCSADWLTVPLQYP